MGPVGLLVRFLHSRVMVWAGLLSVGAFVVSCMFNVTLLPHARWTAWVQDGTVMAWHARQPGVSGPIDPWLASARNASGVHWKGLVAFLPFREATSPVVDRYYVPWFWWALALGGWSIYLIGHRRGMRKANPDACRRCGYPLGAGTEGRTCPECGTRDPPPPSRTRRASSPDASVPDA